jgi:anti-sigma B factor antagonist
MAISADFGSDPDEFHVEVIDSWPGISVVDVAGDVDLHSAPELRDTLSTLVDSDTRQVTLDLSNVTFLDSMGLGVILGTKKRLAATGRELELVVANPEVRRIFEITMLDRIFALHASRAEAGVPD